MYQDAIAAIATAPGEGGIAIVRLSGELSLPVVRCCFRRKRGKFDPSPWHVYYGSIVDGGEARIDECLLTYFSAPRSYTGEDVVEIGIHGGSFVAARILERLIECGATLAQPGEFTKRAFLNGRIDLNQAEAVIDVIRATSDVALKNANLHLAGALTAEIELAKRALVRILALVEAQLDFPDLDIPQATSGVATSLLTDALVALARLVDSARAGRVVKEGYKVVLVGRPNVGKSSLFNRLAGRERAIVTEMPGTTRDTLEVSVNLGGVLVNFVDTAGLRSEGDYIEKLGMQRTEKAMQEADLVVVLLDGTAVLGEEERALLEQTSGYKRLVVLTKADLPMAVPAYPFSSDLHISSLTGVGLPELRDKLTVEARQTVGTEHSLLLTNLRHTQAIVAAKEALQEALFALSSGWELEIVAIDVRRALVFLGEVTGETVSQALTDEIFSQFCIGK